LERAIKEVTSGRKTLRQAEEQLGVPRNTISSHVRAQKSGTKLKNLGGQSVLSEEEEQCIVHAILVCAKWGFPLQFADLKIIVQDFLNRKGTVIKCFKNNQPGKEWVYSFLGRHPEITSGLAENIKRKRAEVGEDSINQYFDSLADSIRDISPENLINYDETNFCDDPGSSKVLVKRGCRHPERVMDVSKGSTSVMFAVSGSGKLLPPFVVYKAKYLHPTWCEGGPSGTRYAVSASGWFEMCTFEEFNKTIIIPELRDKTGKKAVVGGNLASHLSFEVVRLAKQYQIEFILLPHNSTHLTQPIDLTVFRPVKGTWRGELTQWKMSNRGVVPKSEFPKLLKQTIDKLGPAMEKNIKAGFRAAGLIPRDREAVLKKIPRLSDGDYSHLVSEAVLQKLNDSRSPPHQEETKRGQRVAVEPGKSLRAEDFNRDLRTIIDDEGNEPEPIREVNHSDADDPEPQPAAPRKKRMSVSAVQTKKPNIVPKAPKEREKSGRTPKSVVEPPMSFQEKDFIVVKFLTEEDNRIKYYAGELCNILNENEFEIMFLRKRTGKKEIYFVYPDIPDVETVNKSDIIFKLSLKAKVRGKLVFNDNHKFDLQ